MLVSCRRFGVIVCSVGWVEAGGWAARSLKRAWTGASRRRPSLTDQVIVLAFSLRGRRE